MDHEQWEQAPQIFVDTQIITLFKFLETPEKFWPEGATQGRFVITTPIVCELEAIKDEHYSSGQRKRAKMLLDYLEDADDSPRKRKILSGETCLEYYWPESNDITRAGNRFRVHGPDERFIAAIMDASGGSQSKYYVLSDDVGIRLRCKHILASSQKLLKAYKPPQELRYPAEVFNLPQNVKLAVKQLGLELAEAMREEEG
ncbi:MAG TPA: hypothetical protein VGL56_12865 [Fimbriimonadaceae bacterium]|jgi:hypothetical protein